MYTFFYSARVWAEACYRTDLLDRKCVKNFKVCELHFEEACFSKTSTSRKRLLPNAIPTLFDQIQKRPAGEATIDVPQKKITILSGM